MRAEVTEPVVEPCFVLRRQATLDGVLGHAGERAAQVAVAAVLRDPRRQMPLYVVQDVLESGSGLGHRPNLPHAAVTG